MADREIDPDEVSPHVHTKVDVEKKINWLRHAQDHYRGNLSTLIVEAVDNTISDDWILASEADDTTEVDVDLAGVTTDLEEIKSELSALHEQMDAISTSETADEMGETKRMQLANHIRDVLPEAPNEWTMREIMRSEAMLKPHEKVKISGAIDDIAGHLEEPKYHVWEAAVELENKDDSVESFVDDGVRRWYVHNPRVDVPGEIDEEQIPDDVDFESGLEFK